MPSVSGSDKRKRIVGVSFLSERLLEVTEVPMALRRMEQSKAWAKPPVQAELHPSCSGGVGGWAYPQKMPGPAGFPVSFLDCLQQSAPDSAAPRRAGEWLGSGSVAVPATVVPVLVVMLKGVSSSCCCSPGRKCSSSPGFFMVLLVYATLAIILSILVIFFLRKRKETFCLSRLG